MTGRLARSIGVALVAIGLAACEPGSSSPSPAASEVGSSASVAPASGSSSQDASAAAPAGQTDTAWGRIWDSVPATFPTYPGATPAEEAATGPASATLAVSGADARSIAAWMQSALERATYSTEALNGPLEDGSFVLASSGPAPGCRVQVSIAPLGGLTTVTVLYGAACPNP